jgi:hypothetical protein
MVAINGKTKERQNHSHGLRPILFANLEVTMGTLNMNNSPMLKKATAPMFILL